MYVREKEMNSKSKILNIRDTIFKGIFAIATTASILAVVTICWFIFANAIPAINEIGLMEFITGRNWKPTAASPEFGIYPMIVGSIYVTLGAVLVGVPVGILAAIFMSFYCPKKIYNGLQAGINLLAGIPSVVYGLWALYVIVPAIRDNFGGYGTSMLAAIILLAIMILPTVISLSMAALQAVPEEFYHGAVALGASHERAVFTVVLPAANSGVLSAGIMGIGRAIGETMAVKMVAGNQPLLPESLTSGVRTLTTNIIMEMNYAEGLHNMSLIATGAVLFIFILILNTIFNILKSRSEVR